MAKRGHRADPEPTRWHRRLVAAAAASSLATAYGGAVAFKHAWEQLIKYGWTSNRRHAKGWTIDSDTFCPEETQQERKGWTSYLGKLLFCNTTHKAPVEES
ncbi:hypothetical protein PI124_g15488 [Phytophthora idaei]|nr:hypothetical protein PI125_g16928 [Phytophthora idaei]KAG3143511.1 hypothetical protein PI126_g14589 [Phytophthora idaei]KAG3239581.1 hypothetical protein PI124_g15488 [Phytophthora idaei]